MPTLGDYIKRLYINYIAPTKEEVKVGRKEETLVAGDERFPIQKHDPFTKELSVEKCIHAAKQCPLFMKGARKKAKDSIRAWHEIIHQDPKKKPVKEDLDAIRTFIKRNNLQAIWEEFRVASYVTGDGYLLITFENDEDTKLEDAPKKKALPYKVRVINSKYITEIGYINNYYREKVTKHFHYVDTGADIDRWIHPDRIIHLENDKLFGPFGNSKINLLRNIIKSNVNVDIAAGDILSWFSHGYFDVTQEGCDENLEKKWVDTMNAHPGVIVHDETGAVKEIKPEAIDPKPFYDYLILNIAAAFFMPTHILTGIQVGRVTGAEVGTGDYIKDLKDDQELIYNPLLERLYSMILKAKGRSFSKYEIRWNPIYIDELSEAEILFKRIQAADLALNGTRGVGGFIDMKEARRIANEGQIELEINKDIEPKRPMPSPQPPSPPTPHGKEEKEDIQKPNLDEATRVMIQRKKDIALREKKLGEEILKEQEENDKSTV